MATAEPQPQLQETPPVPPSHPPANSAVDAGKEEPPKSVVFRETVESLAVAFILALLFKAFIAEAFVIPTGSMAPTLMGAHKDVVCESCGFQYQCGASLEFNAVGARLPDVSVVGTTCPLCRKPQVSDPNKVPNQATFSGDRILVSKLAYVWNQPRRWDVIVFKFMQDARLNYIKRCIGLPNETIRIREGDIYVRKNDQENRSFEIARKPPHVADAMFQIVSDTDYIPKGLVKAGMPSPWLPLDPNDASWNLEWTEDRWNATCKNGGDSTNWLRYYHRVVDTVAWSHLEEKGGLPVQPKPREPRLITDFVAYNAGYRADVFPKNVERFEREARKAILQGEPFGAGGNDGLHWTGDLAGEFEIETTPGSKTLSLLVVEAGAKHIVDIDLTSGNLTGRVELNGQKLEIFQEENGHAATVTAKTSLRGGGKHRIRFSNVDDQFLFWVDGKPVKWDSSNRLDWRGMEEENGARGPALSEVDPLDGAPLGIGIAGGELRVARARVHRDIYYIAHARGANASMVDYPNLSEALRNSIPAGSREQYARSEHERSVNDLMRNMSIEVMDRNILALRPDVWGKSSMTYSRRAVDFTMREDWYFPMGDNSAASSDARSWPDSYTPGRLMIGRALVVFWPHPWNAPVPYLPNVQRMGLIR